MAPPSQTADVAVKEWLKVGGKKKTHEFNKLAREAFRAAVTCTTSDDPRDVASFVCRSRLGNGDLPVLFLAAYCIYRTGCLIPAPDAHPGCRLLRLFHLSNPFLLLRDEPLTFLHALQGSFLHALKPASDGLTQALRNLQGCGHFQSLAPAEQLGCLILGIHLRSVRFAEFMLDLALGCTGGGQFTLLRVVHGFFVHSGGVDKQRKSFLPSRRVKGRFQKDEQQMHLIRHNRDVSQLRLGHVLGFCGQFLDGSMENHIRKEGTQWRFTVDGLNALQLSASSLMRVHYEQVLISLERLETASANMWNGTQSKAYGRWAGSRSPDAVLAAVQMELRTSTWLQLQGDADTLAENLSRSDIIISACRLQQVLQNFCCLKRTNWVSDMPTVRAAVRKALGR